jgi:hypothetical protein
MFSFLNFQSRTRGTLAALFVFAVLAVGNSMFVVQRGAISVEKSPNDKRDYRALVLDNGMKVLLVSDASADRAAASVNVAAGSNSDPAAFRGLAHFLEHMLFLGTAKYPQSEEYQGFITSHGGSQNAFTAYENTNFYFEIDADYLEPALDRFSQFFIAPTFTAEYVNRERNAVNSEYQSGLQDDGRRSQAVMRAVLNPRHPMAGFSVGSLETLQDHGGVTLRDALLAHYDRYYSANLMSVAVLGKENLDQLEQWVRTHFSAVVNKHRSKPSSKEPMFVAGALPLQLNIEPVRDARALSYSFPIPDMRLRYRERPVDYLANMLGHEGEGSLLKVLRDLGWANALSAGGGFAADNINLFDVNISLTQAGLQHVDEITALLFQFIDLISQKGVAEWQYKEFATMSALAFQYQEPGGAEGLVTGMSERMQFYPLQDLITSNYFYRNFDPRLIHSVLDFMRPDNMLMTISARGVPTDKIEPWYAAKYSKQQIGADRIASWHQYPHQAALATNKPNPFIPEHLAVKPLQAAKLPAATANVTDKPRLLVEGDGVRLWFKQDNQFFTPRSNFFVYAMTPLFQNSLRNSLLANFVVSLVNDRLSAYAYPANLAGADFGIGARSRGFTLALSSYSDKQAQLLETLLKTLTAADFQPERFNIIKTEMIRNWQNAELQTPYMRLFGEVQALVVNPYWSNEENIAEVQSIGFDDVKAFVPAMLSSLRLDALYHGNADEADARDMMALVSRYLHASANAPVSGFGTVLKLPPHTRIIQEMAIAHDDSAIVVYLQAMDDSWHARALVNLLATMMGSPFFDSLRTQQQLGYVVNAGTMPVLKVNGLALTIESPVADPLELEARINVFLSSYAQTLADMPPEQFNAIKSGFLNDLRQVPDQLDALSSRYWSDILLEEFTADSGLKMADAVASVTQQEVLDYYRVHVADLNATRVVARSAGRPHMAAFLARRKEPAAAVVIQAGHTSYADFKAGKQLYSYP